MVLLEKTLESPWDRKEIQPVHPKGNQSWIFIGRTDAEAVTPTLATWCKELTHWKRPRYWERLKAGGEGDVRGWDCWMASLTQWTWVWVNSGSWWWIGRPGMLQSMDSQSWTQLSNWTELTFSETVKFLKHYPFYIHVCVCVCIYIYIYMLRIPRKRKDQVTMLSWVTWQNERKQ